MKNKYPLTRSNSPSRIYLKGHVIDIKFRSTNEMINYCSRLLTDINQILFTMNQVNYTRR